MIINYTFFGVSYAGKESEVLSDLQLQHSALHSQLKNEKAMFTYEMKNVNELENQLDEVDLSYDIVSKLKWFCFRLIHLSIIPNTFICRYEKNDNLIKMHKEILEQKCKMERAQTELKRSKKSIKPFADRDFIFAFAVSYILVLIVAQNRSVSFGVSPIFDGQPNDIYMLMSSQNFLQIVFNSLKLATLNSQNIFSSFQRFSKNLQFGGGIPISNKRNPKICNNSNKISKEFQIYFQFFLNFTEYFASRCHAVILKQMRYKTDNR